MDPLDGTISIFVFADTSPTGAHGKHGARVGLLVDDWAKVSIFPMIVWASHKSKRPLKSVTGAKILAADEDIDMGRDISATFLEPLAQNGALPVCFDSEESFRSLYSQRNSIARSNSGDVSSNCFEFPTGVAHKLS